MNKKELIEKLKTIDGGYGSRYYIAISDVFELVEQLDEPQLIKLKDIIARIKGFDSGTRKVWLDGILGELGSEYGSLKYKQGYDQGKFEGGLAGVERAWNKPVVPQFVADWYEEHKDDFETALFRCIDHIPSVYDEGDLNEFEDWIIDGKTKPFQTLVNMHQFGYEVEKEKRYLVKIVGMDNINGYLSYNKKLKKWFFGIASESRPYRLKHTRKELEEDGFGWVFDCPGVEIEEVGE